MTKPLIPSPIAPGDTIGIIAPSGQILDRKRFEEGIRLLQDWGYTVLFPSFHWPGSGYLSDSDEKRAAEFNRLWADPKIKAIIAARGGFGCLRILDRIDLDQVRRSPKLLVGFSDITILHSWLQEKTGLVCLHGPVVTSLASLEQPTLNQFRQCLVGNWSRTVSFQHIEVLRDGTPSRGTLAGGNLSSIASLLGTPFQPNWSEKIVFLEDIGEPFYRVDRLLTQFFYAGMFNNISGLILGDFSISDEQEPLNRQRYLEAIWNRALELTSLCNTPVWGGFPTGHCPKNMTLPIGSPAVMSSEGAQLQFNL